MCKFGKHYFSIFILLIQLIPSIIGEFECGAGRKPALFHICKAGLYQGLGRVYGMGRNHVQDEGRQFE
jgi:hypothetical protein